MDPLNLPPRDLGTGSVPDPILPSSQRVIVEPTPINIKVFPNTGHHFFFTSFTDAQLRSGGQKESLLEKLCQNNSFPWRQAYDEQGMPVRWVLYRFGDAGLMGKRDLRISVCN